MMQTCNLRARTHGHTYAYAHAHFVVVQLTAADAVAANVSTGAVAVVDVILKQAPKAQVLLLAVLPRGDRNVEAPSLKFLQPSKYPVPCPHATFIACIGFFGLVSTTSYCMAQVCRCTCVAAHKHGGTCAALVHVNSRSSSHALVIKVIVHACMHACMI